MPDAAAETLTDGFHLIIDALKLNDINTIYNVPGIPITDLGRYMQAEGMRVLSFRHEQHAGYAAAIAGFLTKKPEWPDSFSTCHDKLFSDDPHQWFIRARDRRSSAG
jgi:hypothetical protein